jgi:hypothetical protein
MVYPVTGPFTVTESWKGPPNIYGGKPTWGTRTRTWSRQKAPFNLELSFLLAQKSVEKVWGGNGITVVQLDTAFPIPYPASYSQRLYNKAYSSFFGELSKVKAELGSTLGEWRSSGSMIADRANQLVSGIRAAKRGDLSGVKRAWGKHAGIRTKGRAAGNHVLEYSFGWAPLVKDLNSALEVLHNRMPPHYVKKGARLVRESPWSRDLGSIVQTGKITSFHGWSLRARVDLENPNTALAQQLGLVNLASVIWELTPNSYIIDYFVNVSDFLGSFSDRVGITLLSPMKTEYLKIDTLVEGKYKPVYYPGYQAISWKSLDIRVTRSSGISGPTLALRLPWQMSAQRASTSIARLLQQLKGK